MNDLMDEWMNKLDMWNAHTVLRKPRDILAFFFALFLCQPLIQQACLWTDKTGVHFHTLPGGRYGCETACESGKGVGVCVNGMVGEAKPDMTVEKQSRLRKKWSSGINDLTLFLL